MDEEKRVLVSIPSIGYLREMLDCCKKRGLHDENYIVLTSDESIPRSFTQFYKKHPKKLEINKLSENYNSLREKSRLASQYNDKQIEELNREFTNLKSKTSKLNDEIKQEIVSSSNIKVVFCTYDHYTITSDNSKYYRPDVQIIFDPLSQENVDWIRLVQVQID